ncbi:MAG: hypothetical protein ABIY70_14175 [Capsulimonas sp.]|uniref:hypothetical protein n=1 Tax=Capsulimonas sp. TaxID=2494211 RepID=UPI003263FEFE
MGDGIALLGNPQLDEALELTADVLVDKGYLGSSGAAASGGMTIWHSEPDADSRERAKENRRKVDAMYVGPGAEVSVAVDENELIESGLLGSYRKEIGWGKGRERGSKFDTTYLVTRQFRG